MPLILSSTLSQKLDCFKQCHFAELVVRFFFCKPTEVDREIWITRAKRAVTNCFWNDIQRWWNQLFATFLHWQFYNNYNDTYHYVLVLPYHIYNFSFKSGRVFVVGWAHKACDQISQLASCVDPMLYGFKSIYVWLHVLQSHLCQKTTTRSKFINVSFGVFGHIWTAVESECIGARVKGNHKTASQVLAPAVICINTGRQVALNTSGVSGLPRSGQAFQGSRCTTMSLSSYSGV